MRYKVLISISLISFGIFTCDGIGISSKLDFGDDQSSPKIVDTGTQYRSSLPISYKQVKKEDSKTSSDFEGIGVVCVSGGCNKTKSENTSTGSVETDVVVHVKTSVDLNKNKTNVIEDTPDVPVIVGKAGTSDQSAQGRTFSQRPYLVTDTFSSTGPLYSPSLGPSVSPSFIPTYSTYNPSIQSDSIYKSELPTDIKIKTLPPVTVTTIDNGVNIKDVRYKTNGIELRYPYFQQSYHNHYFGENPPPQMVWYPKRHGLSNTVEYKPKSTWKPSVWANGSPHTHTVGAGVTCSCKTHPTTGLQWQPARRTYQEPGSQIDDKLAPLS